MLRIRGQKVTRKGRGNIVRLSTCCGARGFLPGVTETPLGTGSRCLVCVEVGREPVCVSTRHHQEVAVPLSPLGFTV